MPFDLRTYLDQVAQAHAGNPLAYLWEFAPVYACWRWDREHDRQAIGFLTFHRLVIRSFRRTFPGGWIPVQPSSMLPFPTMLADQAGEVRDVAALTAYSADLEAWHHGVHLVLGDAAGAPERHLLQRGFWEFHLFVDLQFSRALEALDLPWDAYLVRVPDAEQRII